VTAKENAAVKEKRKYFELVPLRRSDKEGRCGNFFANGGRGIIINKNGRDVHQIYRPMPVTGEE